MRATLLRALAAGAPAVFTAAWLLLGSLTRGYDQARDTISAVAAVGSPYAGLMVTAFVLQGLGQLAGAVLAWSAPRSRKLSAALAVAGLGTLAAGGLPLPGADGAPWQALGHALSATAAFAGLHLAALAGALSSVVPRGLRVAAVLALALALPHLVWFLLDLGTGGPWFGYAEKVFTTVLLAWCAVLAVRRPLRQAPGGCCRCCDTGRPPAVTSP